MQNNAALIHANLPEAIAQILHDEEFARPLTAICPEYHADYAGYYVTSFGRVLSVRRKSPRFLSERDGIVTLQNARRHRAYAVRVSTLAMRAFWPGVGMTRMRWDTNKIASQTSAYWLIIAPDWLRAQYRQRIADMEYDHYRLESDRALFHWINGGWRGFLKPKPWWLPLHLHCCTNLLCARIVTSLDAAILKGTWFAARHEILAQHHGVPQLFEAYCALDRAFRRA